MLLVLDDVPAVPRNERYMRATQGDITDQAGQSSRLLCSRNPCSEKAFRSSTGVNHIYD